MPAPNEITPAQLSRLIGTPECPAIVDVTLDEDFDADPFLIPTAQRFSHHNTAAILSALGSQSAVVVCQKGQKLSQGVAALLRAEGQRAEYLQGGNHAWRDAQGGLRIPAATLPASGTLWVTRHRPKIDRIACPWLIRRFVDPSAKFLFVAPNAVTAVAERFDALPFDVEGVFWSHRGQRCTFDTMLEEWALNSPALDTLAAIIRAADTNRPEDVPQAAGLLAISVGLSRQYRDDLQQLEAGMAIYDALYRWARDGQSETHDWPGVDR